MIAGLAEEDVELRVYCKVTELLVGRLVDSYDSLIFCYFGIETINNPGVEAVVGYLSGIGVVEFYCGDC